MSCERAFVKGEGNKDADDGEGVVATAAASADGTAGTAGTAKMTKTTKMCSWGCGAQLDCDQVSAGVNNGRPSKAEMLARAAHLLLCPTGGKHARAFYVDFKLAFHKTCGVAGCTYLAYRKPNGTKQPPNVVKKHEAIHSSCSNNCGIRFPCVSNGSGA